jgi:capsular polysaccharide transport system permease protein
MKADDLPMNEALAAVRPPERLRARVWRALTPARLLALLVAVPLSVAALYFSAMAQDRFVSTSIISVRRAANDSVAANGLAMLLTGAGSSSQEDSRFLREYLHSLGLMQKVDEQLRLREHFAASYSDPFFRLWPQASQEWMLEYWRSRVNVQLDELSGLLTLRVEGFEPDYAQRINGFLLKESEAFVNEISHRIAREQMAFAQGELDRAVEKLQTERSALLAFQSRHQVLDPVEQAQAAGALTAELRGQLAKVEAELSTKLSYLNEDAPDVVTLKNQALSLRLQAQRETRGAIQPGDASLNRLAIEFRALKARVVFAEDAYKASLAALENTRLEAGRKVKSLVVIEPPTLPQTAAYPRRIYNLITVLVICLLVFATVRLTVATVNEHRE